MMASRASSLLVVAVAMCLLVTGCRPAGKESGASPTAVEAMNRGVSFMGQYQYDAAVKAFEEALRAAPDLTDARVNLAIARFNRSQKDQQDIEQANALLDGVLQNDPANVRALYFKGIILQHLGQTDAALACFEKVAQQRPDDGVVWYLLGVCKQRLGQDAGKELARAIELRPNLVSAHYKLWQTLQAAGQTEKAAPYLEKFKQLRESPLGEIIELPQYNQMGDLALVLPVAAQRPPPIAKSSYRAGAPRQVISRSLASPPQTNSAPSASRPFGGAAFGDSDGDGQPDLFLVAWLGATPGVPFCLRGGAGGPPFPAPTNWGLESVEQPLTCAVGDFDNDEVPDLFVVCSNTNHLFHGSTNGRFSEVTSALGITASGGRTRSALWLDADHDGDLDLFVCNSGGPNQLFNNNGDGTFTNIAASAGVAVPDGGSVMVLPGDLDGDRDMDLIVLRSDAPARLFLNDLQGKYHEADLGALDIRGDLGGALQDFDGDGTLDLIVLGNHPPELKLLLGDGQGHFRLSGTFAESTKAAASWGPLRALRVADLDLDGDLDVACFAAEGHALLNDGTGRFVLQARMWSVSAGAELAGAELCDLTSDLVPDLLLLERGKISRVLLVPGELSPPSTALSIAPSGVRSRDKRTRSPASGYGALLTVRAGLREQRLLFTGLSGGCNQSHVCAVLGLGGARQADYVQILWPDGVAQVELALAAGGQCQKVAELQRKISSCPVLFAWNGTRFGFVTDFAGVGGLGYFVAPGEYAQPQPLEHIKLEPEQLRLRAGAYELRITEPMEETAYVDRLELLAIDHPAGWRIFPDERLAITGSQPTHELLVVEQPIFPRRAADPEGRDCTERLMRVDRVYAYAPELDRRFFGFCKVHTLELDFGDALAGLSTNHPVFLFLNGYLEYPYSQTAYAAGQARVGWEPIRIERRLPDGRWRTIVADAGAFGGMARTMTVNLSALAGERSCQLRLTSNLEIYYDQVFLGALANRDRVRVHSLPMRAAELRRVGFAREISPDGRMPLLYDYDRSDPTAPFHVLRGAYTRYGPVLELLTTFDDNYVLVGPGDEIAVKFDAATLPVPSAAMTHSFVLVSHAWCKDSDLYTATPQTLEPLPFKAMSRYPYPATERYPQTEDHRRFRETYNTRLVK